MQENNGLQQAKQNAAAFNEQDRQLQKSDNIAIWVLLISAFVVILNETVMGVALPVLMQNMHLDAHTGQWLTTAFLLTMSVVIPMTGTLMQRISTRGLYFTAMVFFLAGTVLCAVAPAFWLLLAGRIVQAVGTAITMPLLMTTVVTVVPAHMRGSVMGRVSVVISVAPAIGPTVSGLVLQSLSWRWLFIIMLPIIVAALVLAIIFLRNVGTSRKALMDFISVVLSVLGFGGLVYGLSTIGESTSGALVPPAVPLVIGALCLILFVWRQSSLQRTEQALLDMRVFSQKPYAVGALTLGISMMGMFGTIVLLPIYASGSLSLDTLAIGLLMLPGGILMGVMGPIVGRLVDMRGARPVLVLGTVLLATAMWLYTLLTENSSVWYLLSCHIVMSLGLSMTFTPVFSAALGSLPRHLASHGSAMISTLQQVAGAAGIAIFVSVYGIFSAASNATSVAAQLADGIHAAYLLAALMCTAVIAVAFLMPNTLTEQNQHKK